MSFSQLPYSIHPFAESTAATLFCEQFLEKRGDTSYPELPDSIKNKRIMCPNVTVMWLSS